VTTSETTAKGPGRARGPEPTAREAEAEAPVNKGRGARSGERPRDGYPAEQRARPWKWSRPVKTESRPPEHIDPRIRERLIEVQREAGRRRLRILLVMSCVLSAAGISYLAVMSPILDVDHIAIAGTSHVSPAAVRAAAGVHRGDHLLFIDTGAVARRIERIPWVRAAKVERDLPGTLRIAVSEYTPAAYVRVAGAVMLVAADGHVIGRAPDAPAGTVELRGVRGAYAAGDVLAPSGVANIVPHLPAALALRVEAVDASGSGVALVLRDGGEIRLGNSSDLAAKAASAQAVIDHLAGTHFSYIDVSTPDRVISHA
jgi:cell division protein FtsQ